MLGKEVNARRQTPDVRSRTFSAKSGFFRVDTLAPRPTGKAIPTRPGAHSGVLRKDAWGSFSGVHSLAHDLQGVPPGFLF